MRTRLAALALLPLLAACGGHKNSGGSFPHGAPTKANAVVRTSEGSFTIDLDVSAAPHAVGSFEQLARKGFFNRTIFHRIVPGFVIQGGDPTGTGTGGPGYETVDTPAAGTTYKHGTVAMAKTEQEAAGTAGSQFFVVTASNAGLPPEYAILGVVTKGLKVVERIGRLGNRVTERPTRRVAVLKMTVTP